MLVAMASPSSAVAMRPASIKAVLATLAAFVMSSCRSDPGICQSGFLMKAAVGALVALTTSLVPVSFMRASESMLAVTTRSQPITRSASPVPTRTACSSSGELAMRTCDITGPPFCARPDMSSTVVPRPSRWAAMERIWPMVMTPVPPMPVMIAPKGRPIAGRMGSGRAKSMSPTAPALPFFSVPPSTVTKLGQKPFTQE